MTRSVGEVRYDFWSALVLGCICLPCFGLIFGIGPLMEDGSALVLIPLFTALTTWCWIMVGMTLYELRHEVKKND